MIATHMRYFCGCRRVTIDGRVSTATFCEQHAPQDDLGRGYRLSRNGIPLAWFLGCGIVTALFLALIRCLV